MADEARINIVSKQISEFSTNVTIDDVVYHVQTEDMGPKSCKIVTRIFNKGEVVFSRTSDYGHLIKLKTFAARLQAQMEKQHKAAISGFLSEKSLSQKTKNEYFEEIQQLLRRGNGKSALDTLKAALEKYPDDPFFLSYFGCLLAIVENKPKEGITICERALKMLETSVPFGSEFFYPVFYLNLGRVYLKDNNKQEAIKAFSEGLRNDPENRDLLWELKKLGSRKQPPIPFLHRSNPINKYIGMLIRKQPR